MTAIAKAFLRAFISTSTPLNSAIIKQLALFCAAALLIALLSLTYGLDLSPGLF